MVSESTAACGIAVPQRTKRKIELPVFPGAKDYHEKALGRNPRWDGWLDVEASPLILADPAFPRLRAPHPSTLLPSPPFHVVLLLPSPQASAGSHRPPSSLLSGTPGLPSHLAAPPLLLGTYFKRSPASVSVSPYTSSHETTALPFPPRWHPPLAALRGQLRAST